MVGMLRDRFITSRTSTSGKLSFLLWAQPSSAMAMCRSKRSDTDFFLSFGFPWKNDPSHCLITLSIFSVLNEKEITFTSRVADQLEHVQFCFMSNTNEMLMYLTTGAYTLIYASWIYNTLANTIHINFSVIANGIMSLGQTLNVLTILTHCVKGQSMRFIMKF